LSIALIILYYSFPYICVRGIGKLTNESIEVYLNGNPFKD